MPNMKNQETLAQIKEELEGVSAVWVVDYCGLTVKEIHELRSNIRETGATMKVYKNTLMHIALAESDLPTLDDMLEGPSAFVFAGSDVAAAAKAVKNFAKKNPNLEIKGGLMEGAAVSAAQVEAIASLPSREGSGADRRCHFRRRTRPCRCPQWRAERTGPGREGRGRPEGSCLRRSRAAWDEPPDRRKTRRPEETGRFERKRTWLLRVKRSSKL